MAKACTKCKKSYPETVEYFHRDRYMTSGLKSWCKQCHARYSREHAKPSAYRAERRRGNHPYYFKSYLKYKYKISIEAYDVLANSQGGLCAICGKTPKDGRRLCLDHNHKDGNNRGLLCNRCNYAIGLVEEIPNWSDRAMSYLVKYDIAKHEEEFK